MKKLFHIAKANLFKHKGASISLFAIVMIVSAVTTLGLSVIFEVEKDFYKGVERMHSLHSLILMPREKFEASFEDIIKNDPRTAEYEIKEVLSGFFKINYGGEIDWGVIIADINEPLRISSPKMTEIDLSISPERAIYLPVYAKNFGYKTGDVFTITYINKPFDLIVSGFYEANELSVSNGIAMKFFVSNDCYQYLSRQFIRFNWIAVRHFDPKVSSEFCNEFFDHAGLVENWYSDLTFTWTINEIKDMNMFPIMILCTLIILFSIITIVISLIVIRFRVTNNIDDTMREIGILKASGYTSFQIILCYLTEYLLLVLPASVLGVFLPMPVFGFFRQILSSVTGLSWTFGINFNAGFLAAIIITIFVLLFVFISCRKIKILPPVDALRGGIASNNFRRNFFPLGKGVGNVSLRLGLKNMFAYLKLYVMIGVIIACVSIAVTIMSVLYQNFVIDPLHIMKMAGGEMGDISITVTKQTDADNMAIEIEKMPEVRKTSMVEWQIYKIDDYLTFNFILNDYEKMEFFKAHEGRLPRYDNEIAIPKLFAGLLGKKIGDNVTVRTGGLSEDFIITGYFSTMSNGGHSSAITLDGLRRLIPDAKRSNITIYLNDDVKFDDFVKKLNNNFGILNVYKHDENDKFANARKHAEEKISAYLEIYDIDSVEYSVFYEGEIIFSGSSEIYQIKTITDDKELVMAQLGIYSDITSAVTQLIALVSLIILSLILYMTVRSIVTKRRRELGILKSCGFTTKQLARQLAISFMPVASTGILSGCLSGVFLANPLLSALFSSTGIYNASFAINPAAVAAIGVIAMLTIFFVANISAMRIKHISVYELLTE